MPEPAPATVGDFKVEWEPPSPVNGVSGPPDILLQGSDDAVVKAHKTILSCNTDMFNAVLGMDVGENAEGAQLDGLDVLRIEAPGTVIALVIPFCYNIAGPRLANTHQEQLLQAYQLSHRFGALRAQRALALALYRL